MITSHGKCYTNYPDKEFNCSPKADKQFHCARFWMTSREERTTVASFSPRNKVLLRSSTPDLGSSVENLLNYIKVCHNNNEPAKDGKQSFNKALIL